VDAAALLRLAAAVPVLAWVLSLARWLLPLDAVAALGGLAFEWPLLLLGPAAAPVPLPELAFPLSPELALLPLPPALLLPLPALAPPPPRPPVLELALLPPLPFPFPPLPFPLPLPFPPLLPFPLPPAFP
jgi:hypothetical protein